jgi:myosin heavy subunit
MKQFGIDSLDDLKSDEEKKKFFKAVDKSHDAKNESVIEELMSIAEETINEFKLKDSDIEKLKQGVKQGKPIKGFKIDKPQKVKTSDEELEEEMKDLEPNAEGIYAMVKDPHKSDEKDPKDDILAQYDDASVKADVKKKGGADMSKVQDAPKMMAAMKKINAMYKSEKYHQTKPGSINDVVAQMQMNEQKTVTIKVKEFSAMVETYLAKGGVTHNISPVLTESELSKVLPLNEVRTFIDTYNKWFLTNYKAEEFIIRDELEG